MYTSILRICLILVVVARTSGESCDADPFQLTNFTFKRQNDESRLYFILTCGLIDNVRLDPIKHENDCGSHMHSVYGSNRFGAQITPDDQSLPNDKLSNTTCSCPADGSSYWVPSLYYRDPKDEKLYIVPSYIKAYYFNRGNTQPLQPLPQNLRMIRGDPLRNKPLDFNGSDSTLVVWEGTDIAGSFPSWLDHDWQLRIMFPNCWDGINLVTSKENENTHVAFRDDITGLCPDTHPVRIPQLFMEIQYQVAFMTASSRDDFVFSMGDVNGWGGHADYVSGWNNDVLDAALNTCWDFDMTNPDCALHQFNGVYAKNPGGYYKSTPLEEVTGIADLLVTDDEAVNTGLEPAECTFSEESDYIYDFIPNIYGSFQKDC